MTRMRRRFLTLGPVVLAAVCAAQPAGGASLRVASGVTAPCASDLCGGGWEYGAEEEEDFSRQERSAGEEPPHEETETRRQGGQERQAGDPPGRESDEP